MRYKIGDEVVLRDDTGIESMRGKNVIVEHVDNKGTLYINSNSVFDGLGLSFIDSDINHTKTAELHNKDKALKHYQGELEKIAAEKNGYEVAVKEMGYADNQATSNIQRHKELTDFMHQTYIDKNKDYGDSFGQTHEKYGALAGLTRIADKFHRLENIILNDTTIQVDDESVIDTLVDMSNYGLLLAMELEKEMEE